MDGRLREPRSVKEHVDLAGRVQLGELQRHPFVHVLVERAQGQDGHCRVDHVVDGDEKLVEDSLDGLVEALKVNESVSRKCLS